MKKINFVVVLALVLRVAFLNRAPIGFNPDEASFGYDAYSILKTGRDQWGKSLPLVLESFGDFKAPLYSYLAIPFVAVFGLDPIAVRIPNALSGTFAVYVFYILIKEIFIYEKASKRNWFSVNYPKKRNFIALTAAFLFAISPWHVAMSRGAYEANLTTLFLPLGIYWFYKFINYKKSKYLYLSSFIFGLNLFTYHAAKLITVLIIVVMLVIFRKEFKNLGHVALKVAGIFAFFIILTVYTFAQGAGARVADVSIFKLSLAQASAERIRAYNNGLPDTVARGFHNKYQAFAKSGASNYLSYISPQFLFTRGAGEKTYGMSDDRGVLYWFELPLLVAFIIWFSRRRISDSILLIIFWFLFSPIPASLAIGPGFAANRAVVMLPSIYLFAAIGAYEIFNWNGFRSKTGIVNRLVYPTFVVSALWFFISFIENYFFVSPSKIAKDTLYGNLEAMNYIKNYTDRNIIVSRKLSEPHIYVAFANKTDPEFYQGNTESWDYKARGLGWVDQMGEYKLANYIFKNIHYQEWVEKDVILVGKPEEFPENVIPFKKFSTPSGDDLIYIVDTRSTYYAKEAK